MASIKGLNVTVFQIRKFASHLSVSRSGDLSWPFRAMRLRFYQGASETQSSFRTHSQDQKMLSIHISTSLTNAHSVDRESSSIESSSRRPWPRYKLTPGPSTGASDGRHRQQLRRRHRQPPKQPACRNCGVLSVPACRVSKTARPVNATPLGREPAMWLHS
jgi:hypothetical protein